MDQDEELDNNTHNLKNKTPDEFIVTTNPIYTPYLLRSLEKEDHPSANEIDEYMRQPEITTSTPSERLFSDAGNLMTSKRTRISPELFKRMLFLKRNIDQYQNIHPE
ncbi:9096_t:CDS:2 [Racocetra persica]|uniref:9096_t:CDS:1 n=1 Tax=Racocetra persica TaxID=160502 RepID=A0ACA9LHB0_9GLOM|nr:9096_t:CDS:2 [Racocetra persica]